MSQRQTIGSKRKPNLLLVIAIIVAAALMLAVAVGYSGSSFHGVPLLVIAAVLAFAIQWLAFIPAYKLQTDRFFDLIGSLSFIVVSAVVLLLSGKIDNRSLLLVALVLLWALRLGSFLLRRVIEDGGDQRFEQIKPNAARFLLTWTLQGLWVFMTSLAVLAALSSPVQATLTAIDALAVLIWFAGLSMEAIADRQKRLFKAKPENAGEFIQTGLWAWSRHPNYFAEMLLWFAVFILAMPVLTGSLWLAVTAPAFVVLLLTKVSGIPLLEKRADKQWGERADYLAYKAATPLLIPRRPKAG